MELPITVSFRPYAAKELLEGNLVFMLGDLPTLWDYVESPNWGMARYTRKKLLCGDCVLMWHEESELDRFTRRVFEEQEQGKG